MCDYRSEETCSVCGLWESDSLVGNESFLRCSVCETQGACLISHKDLGAHWGALSKKLMDSTLTIVHPSCIHLSKQQAKHARAYPWQCADCKVCELCGEHGDDEKLLFCDICDRGSHAFCLDPPLEHIPESISSFQTWTKRDDLTRHVYGHRWMALWALQDKEIS